MTHSELCEVYTAADTADAHLMKGALEVAGIETGIVGDMIDDLFWWGLFPPPISPRICVHADDVERTKEVIREHDAQRRRNRSTAGWKCAACGESNEPSFDVCWSCQGQRPSLPEPRTE